MGEDGPANDFPIDRLDIIDPIRLQGVPVPPRRWLWQDWLPLGTTSALYGDGATGKTLLAQQLLTACATGKPFLGLPVMRCRALGVFCEDDKDELHRRQVAINAALGVDFSDLENVQWLSRTGADNLLCTFAPDGRCLKTAFFDQIMKVATETGVQLVAVDTATDTFGGGENIRTHVRQFIGLLHRLAHAIDGAVLLLAHPSLTGRASGSGDSGSTAWSNTVRSRLYLKRQEAVNGEIPDSDVRILSRLKANYASFGVELTLRYDAGAFTLEDADEGGADEGHLRSRAAEAAFLQGLAELAAANFRCNAHKGQGNFAPKALREKSRAAGSFSEIELAAAMNRLIKSERLACLEDGPPARRRSYLVATAPDLPGV